MTEEQKLLEEARNNAWTFPGLEPPAGAVYIGAVKTEKDVYFYYRGREGNFYYDTERMRRFEMEMQEARKRKKERGRRGMDAKKMTAEVGASNGQ